MRARPMEERRENFDADRNVVELVRAKIQEFLRENGGLENGNITYVRGTVGFGPMATHYHEIEWMTPKAFTEMTPKDIMLKGREFRDQIMEILKANKTQLVNIIATQGDEHFYNTHVVLPVSAQAW